MKKFDDPFKRWATAFGAGWKAGFGGTPRWKLALSLLVAVAVVAAFLRR
jgi:hypothetical protein